MSILCRFGIHRWAFTWPWTEVPRYGGPVLLCLRCHKRHP